MIEVKNVSKRFKEIAAVQQVSFRVEAGEVYGLLGENGAGKTTTMRMMATVLTPTEGDIEISGFSVRQQPLEVRRRIGILFGGDVGLYSRLTAMKMSSRSSVPNCSRKASNPPANRSLPL